MKKIRLKWLVLFSVLLVCIVAVLSINFYADRRLQKEIDKLSAKKLQGLYSIQVGKADINVWTGGLNAVDIKVWTDTAAWSQLRQSWPDSFPPVFNLSLRSLDIRRFSWLSYFMHDKIKLKGFFVDQPVGYMLMQSDTAKTKVTFQERLNRLQQSLSPVAKSLYIKEISLHKAEVVLKVLEKQDTVQHYLSGINLLLTDLSINENITPLNFCSDLAVDTEHGESRSTNGTHKMAFEKFRLSKAEHTLAFEQFSVLPQIDEKAFFSRQTVRVNYLSFRSPDIRLKGFDMEKLLDSGYLLADSLQMEKPTLKAIVNHYLPLPYRKILPHELVQKARFLFDIKNVMIKDWDISVTARLPGEDYLLDFNHTYVNADNLSNDSTLMDLKHPFQIWAEGDFMNRSPIKLQLNLFLLTPGFNGNYTATVRNVPLSILNPVISNKNISIASGFMNLAEISANIQNGVAKGTVKMQYKDLEVNLLRKNSRKPRKILSDLADILIKDNNVRDNDPDTPFVIGEIDHTRDRQEGFLLFLWRSIQDGMLPSIAPVAKNFKQPGPK